MTTNITATESKLPIIVRGNLEDIVFIDSVE